MLSFVKLMTFVCTLELSFAAFAGSVVKCGNLQNPDGTVISEAPSYAVSKTAEGFSLEETIPGGIVRSYRLEAAGDGDEDYSAYNVIDEAGTALVQKVNIQEAFEWADLINLDGDSVNKCE